MSSGTKTERHTALNALMLNVRFLAEHHIQFTSMFDEGSKEWILTYPLGPLAPAIQNS